ncbi:alpha/beta hydrolase [Saprospiraceae bacterium]|nr:alpha/beta hydrolase [Saprospiraceae bacterium]
MNFKNLFTYLFVCLLLLASCNTKESSNATSQLLNVPLQGSLDVEGFNMEYKIEGIGIPVLVPGSTIYHPRTFSENLRKECQLIFMNMRWYNPSYVPQGADAITIDVIVEDIERMRKHLGLGRVAVMGHSFHGLVALEYARKYPNNVTQVIAISTPAQKGPEGSQMETDYWTNNASDERKLKYQQNWEANKEKIGQMNMNDGAIATYVNNAPIYYRDLDYDSKELWEGVQLNFTVMGRVFTDLFNGYKISNGSEISAPIFLALGAFDFSAPPVLWDDQKVYLPFLDYNLFSESGHSPQLEESALFDEKLVAWLKK